MGRHNDDYSSSSEDEDRRKRSRKSHKKSSSRHEEEGRRSRKRKRAKADRRRDDDEDDDSIGASDHQRKQKSGRGENGDSSDESDRRSRKREKKDKKQRRKDEKSSTRATAATTNDDPGQERHYQFVDALHDLFDDHPALSTELPIMLIRMASGASLDLSQMSDTGAAQRLGNVFQKMMPFGVVKDQRSWTWKSPGGANTNTELLLVKIARSLLDQVGVTMEAVSNFGRKEVAMPEVTAPVVVVKGPARPPTAIQLDTTAFLDQFGKKQNKDAPSLAEELTTLCQMIMNGESIAVDGIPDESLRLAMEAIFVKAGLEKAEIGNEDSDDGSDNDEPTMGYGLPEEGDHQMAHANMTAIIEACQSTRSIIGAAAIALDSDDEEGPAPVGQARAPTMDLDRIKAMAAQRKEELDHLDPNYVKPTRDGDREEWMLTPGEHDFLQGITSGMSKTRNFQNKKVNDRVPAPDEAVMDPKIQAEVDAIYAAHREARGPSLMDQHRGKVAKEKAAKAAAAHGGGFGWNRDKDLDAGRRVDKDALNMILGGAGSELKDKFQGGYGRS